jgi:NAD(P)-dependent dehydrogenase (short-subunit alcohol dehydrogenase family)
VQLAKAMAIDHAGDNIRVNTLSPGATQTRRMVLRHGDMEDAVRYNAPKHLLNRLGQPSEMATAALFLASEASSFMTGADLLVDGGYTAFLGTSAIHRGALPRAHFDGESKPPRE